MKNYPRFVISLFLFLLLSLTSTAYGQSLSTNKLKVNAAPRLVVSNDEGLAAFFSGLSNGYTVVAGGANFPDVPCAENGKKVYYDEVRVLDGDNWCVVGKLPHMAASGCSATTPYGVACVGGRDTADFHSDAFLLNVNPRQDVQDAAKAQSVNDAHSSAFDVSITMLPATPSPAVDAAMAYAQGTLYVLLGHEIYSLSLPDGKKWNVVTTVPGPARIQPVMAVQSGATASCLYLFGGYTIDSVTQGGLRTAAGRTTCLTDGLCLNLKTLEWSTTAPLPDGLTLTGGTAATSGYSHILLMGGVNKQVFENRLNDSNPTNDYFLHEPAWYRFNRQIMVYHTITNSWFPLAEGDYVARAGAGLVQQTDGSLLLINGETKPGIRSAEVARLEIAHDTSFGWLNWLVLIVYLFGMLGLGYYFMRRESGADDFFKGGGRIPWWAAGISIYATMLSAITYMSIPAKAYATNWTYYPMLVTILFVSFPVIKYYLPYFRRLNITSAYEYLEVRFNLATRLLSSGLFIIFMVARMALVLYLPSLALTAVTGINIQLCIVLMGIVTIIYCTMGGVEAVVWGDVVQGIILVGGAIFAAVFLILNTEGGASAFVEIGQANDKFRLFEWSMDYRSVTFWVAIIGGIANNLISYTSDQTVIQRYLTTKDERSAGRSILMNGVMCVCISVVFYVIGTGLYTFFQTHPAELDITMQKGDAIFPFFMMSQMPAGVAGLLIAAIFAATMSTISSNINSVSTAFSVDFYKRLVMRKAINNASANGAVADVVDSTSKMVDNASIEGNNASMEGNNASIEGNNATMEGNNATVESNSATMESNSATMESNSVDDAKLLRVARQTCVISGVIGVAIALMMASWDILSLLDYFNTILGLLTGGLGGLFLMGIFIPRIKGRAALIGFVSGTAFVFWLQFFTDANLFLFGAAGIAVSVTVAFIVSLFDRQEIE